MSKKSTVEFRENRLNSIVGYVGQISDLSKQLNNSCLKNADRSFNQTYQCQQITSILTLLSIKDSAFVFHAPVGCTGCAGSLNIQYKIGQTQRGISKPINAKWISSNFDDSDVIHGGEAKLREAILTAESRYKPKIIFVLASCASGIIGDDIDTVVNQTQSETEAKLIPIHCEGFSSKVSSTGYDTCYNAILEYFIEPSAKKEDDLINVLSTITFSVWDQLELKRLLDKLSLKPNFIPSFASAEDLKRITAAKLNTSICKVHGDYLFEVLESKYNIPHTNTLMPLGIKNTDNWLLEIGELTGKTEETKQLIEEEHKRIEESLQALRKELKGIRAFISAGSGRGITAASLAEDLGFEVVGIHTFHLDNILADEVEELTNQQYDFIFDVANMQPFEQANIIEKLKPDVVISIGTNVIWAGKQGVPSLNIIDDQKKFLGYNGVLSIGRDLVNTLKNPGFNIKLSKHRKLPYTDTWLQDTPFKYLKNTEGN
ncbi:MAG: nitrogenase component 1 [Bacillota bacterium]|nr:nitrogenase component 1 [Bacillota bacterium]